MQLKQYTLIFGLLHKAGGGIPRKGLGKRCPGARAFCLRALGLQSREGVEVGFHTSSNKCVSSISPHTSGRSLYLFPHL